MRYAPLAVLLLSLPAAAEPLPLPAWATPGSESRSVRQALDDLHAAGVSFDGTEDIAFTSVWEGGPEASWVFSGGPPGGTPTRYFHYLWAEDPSGRVVLSVVCEDTPEACRAHMEALDQAGPPPPIPPPPSPPPPPPGHSPVVAQSGWIPGPEGPIPARGVDQAPQCDKCAAVHYPVESGFAGASGDVMLRISIDEQGKVEHVAVHHPSGDPTLDLSAMRQARRFVFQPAKRNGAVVPGAALMPVRFAHSNDPRGADIEARRIIPLGDLGAAVAAARPGQSTPANITQPDQARTFLDHACLAEEIETYPDHRVVLQQGPNGQSYWTLFQEDSPLQGGVIRRRMVQVGNKVEVKVSYACKTEGDSCVLMEQYLEQNLRRFYPHVTQVQGRSNPGSKKCDPR